MIDQIITLPKPWYSARVFDLSEVVADTGDALIYRHCLYMKNPHAEGGRVLLMSRQYSIPKAEAGPV